MYNIKMKLLCVWLVLMTYPFLSKGACPDIIKREEWGASEPESVKELAENPPPYVVVHHSATPECNTTESCKTRIKNIQEYHMQTLEWEDIGYNFLIGGDGNIYEGRGWGVHGAHLVPYNRRSIGVCLIGNFQDDEPLEKQLEALANLNECGVEIGNITESYHLIGHRQGSATLCPGDKLFDIVQNLTHFDANPS